MFSIGRPVWNAMSSGNLTRHNFPKGEADKSVALEPITWHTPVRNNLALPGKSIMIIQGSMVLGGSELGCLHILRHLALAGYRVTMVFTRLKYPDGQALRPQILQYTNDVQVLPAFLRMNDFPRYLTYLIRTRGVDVALISNSQLLYEILPAMAEMNPSVKWVDYVRSPPFLKFFPG